MEKLTTKQPSITSASSSSLSCSNARGNRTAPMVKLSSIAYSGALSTGLEKWILQLWLVSKWEITNNVAFLSASGTSGIIPQR